MSKLYKKAALGGTFDRLHAGHEHLIQTAFAQADEVVIGLTNYELVQDKDLADIIQTYEDRKQALIAFIDNQVGSKSYKVTDLDDVYGPTLTDQIIDVLVVSNQTKPGAVKINQRRVELQLEPLPIVEADLIRDEEGAYISSTRIRRGEIDRTGKSYLRFFDKNRLVKEEALTEIKKPQGEIITNDNRLSFLHSMKPSTKIALVGDVVTDYFVNHNIPFDYAIVDGHTRREEERMWSRPENWLFKSCHNQAGVIESLAVNVLHDLLNNDRGLLEVEGEEDLLAFPLLLLLPLGSVVVYGQPNIGMVMIRVSEETKSYYASLLE